MPILLLILLFPIIELTLLTMLAHWIGLGTTLLYLIVSALLGSLMLRNQKMAALLTLGSIMRQGQGVSVYSLLWPLRYLLAGVLFIIPGVLSELAAILLLLPLKGPNIQTRTTTQMPPDDGVIEGEFNRVDDPQDTLRKLD
jgi:UPF0716 protein FxsA